MRIAIVCHEYPPLGGGGGNAALHVARELAAGGDEILVLTSSGPGLPSREQAERLVVERWWTGRRRRYAPAAPTLLAFCLACRLRLAPRLRDFRPDGVLAFFAVPAGPFALRAARGLRVPVVLSLQGSDVPGFSRQRLGGLLAAVARPLIRQAVLGADWVAPNSPVLSDLMRRFEPRVEPWQRIVRNGIEPERIALAPARSAGAAVRLIQVGQLIDRKRVDWTLNAVAALRRLGRPVECVVVGDGPRRDSLSRVAHALGIAEVVDFRGHLPRDSVFAELRSSDIYVMPSRAEGMSNAALEAMASGVPVVIARNGSHDLVEGAGCGEVFASDDPQSYLAALLKVVDDPDRSRLGALGLHGARQHSWARCAQEFRTLLSSPRRALAAEER